VATISLTSTVVVMDSDVVQLHNGARLVTEITDLIIQFCRKRGDGLCHVFVPHATVGVALIETGSGSEFDLEDAIDRLLPRDGSYWHRHGSRGHGRDHVLPAFVSPSLRCQCLTVGPHSVPGKAWCLLTPTPITLTGVCGFVPV